jgi:hypothetical protein
MSGANPWFRICISCFLKEIAEFVENGNSKLLLLALSRLFSLFPQPQKAEFIEEVRKAS